MLFSFLFWLCPFLKNRIVYFGFVFRFFLFYSVPIKLERGFQKNNLSIFNLGLSRFRYRGNFFLSHAISFWFCGVSKLRWLVKFFIQFLSTGFRENLSQVKTS